MPTGLDHPTQVEDQDAVRPLHGTQPVGHHQQAAGRGQPVDGRLDRRLTLRVQARGGLVEYHQPGIAQKGSGQCDALDLSARKPGSALPDGGIPTLG